MSIKKFVERLREDTIISEEDVRVKVMEPLFALLNYDSKYIANAFPIYGKSGCKDDTKQADIIVFSEPHKPQHREKQSREWVREKSLIIVELKKPSENIDNAQDQGAYYAMWGRAPIYVITNGIDISLYKIENNSADTLLLNSSLNDLPNCWDNFAGWLSFSNLKNFKNNPHQPFLVIPDNSSKWKIVSFDNQRGIADAILGLKLGENNVEKCPKLQIYEKAKLNLELLHYSLIEGSAGSGKSLTAYQLAYDYFLKGYVVYKYKNEIEFSVLNFNTPGEKKVFIIDDMQNMNGVDIGELIKHTSERLKLICTITSSLQLDVKNSHISSKEEIAKVKSQYLMNKKEVYEVVHKVDDSVGESYTSETLEMRLDKAEKEADSLWMFNYILRGGWNSAKEDYLSLSEKDRYDWILIYLAILQILNLDSMVSIDELMFIINFTCKSKQWILDGIDFMKNNKIIVEENCKYRFHHIRYAAVIIERNIERLAYNERNILIDMIKYNLKGKYSLQGIFWLLNLLRNVRLDIIDDEIWNHLKYRCFKEIHTEKNQFPIFVISECMRLNENLYEDVLVNNIEDVVRWIENANCHTGVALHDLINQFNNHKEFKSKYETYFYSKINLKKICYNINNLSYDDMFSIIYMMDRFEILYEKEIKNIISDNINWDGISDKIINANINNIWGVAYIITFLFLINKQKGIRTYDEIEDLFIRNIKERPLEAYWEMSSRLLSYVFGNSYFIQKKKKKHLLLREERLIKAIDYVKVAKEISKSNRHDWTRYSEFICWIMDVNKQTAIKILERINFDILETNLHKYWSKPPFEMRLLLYTLHNACDGKLYVNQLIEKNINNILVADPLLSLININLPVNCYEKGYKIDIFGHNGDYHTALEVLLALHDKNIDVYDKALSYAEKHLCNQIENLIPCIGYHDDGLTHLLTFLWENNREYLVGIYQKIDEDNAKKYWNNYLDDLKRYKEKSGYELLFNICDYAKTSLEKFAFAEDIIDKIPQKNRTKINFTNIIREKTNEK